MIRELIFALPPLGEGSRVADLCSGSGRAALATLEAYPEAHVTLVEMDKRRSKIAVERAQALGFESQVAVRNEVIDPDASDDRVIGGHDDGGGYDLITATCAIRVMANPPAHYAISGSRSSSGDAGSGGGTDKDRVVVDAHNGQPVDDPVARRYLQLFQLCLRSLRPGGHFIMGDHTGSLGLYDQMRLMEEAGFVEIDCAWRKRDFFVCGARRPL
jgi:SAM-dependent methyltransferase